LAENSAIPRHNITTLPRFVIRPANKNTPNSQKITNHTKRYPSTANEKLNAQKCTNSINLFEETALSRFVFDLVADLSPLSEGQQRRVTSIID
jgi:hypothetical protein